MKNKYGFYHSKDKNGCDCSMNENKLITITKYKLQRVFRFGVAVGLTVGIFFISAVWLR